jgi:hypothetical protein
VEDERFEELMRVARDRAHVKPYDFVVGELSWENAQRELRRTVKTLEAECSSDQWMKVLDALANGWP